MISISKVEIAAGGLTGAFIVALVLILFRKKVSITPWPIPPQILPTAPQGTVFSAQHLRASYDNISQSWNTLNVLQAELNMLLQTGVGTIRIDIGFDAFATNNTTLISNLDTTVQQVRANGKKLCIADAAREYYRKHKQLWSDFQTEWIDRVNTLSARYTPDYYVTIKEPGWYVPMILDPYNITAASLLSLQQTLYTTVKANASNCLVGVAMQGGKWFSQTTGVMYQFAKAMQVSPYADFAGFDCYSYNDYQNIVSFNSVNPTSKPVWIPEFWPTTEPTSDYSSDSSAIRSAYSLFVENLINFDMMSTFFTDSFVNYSLPSFTISSEIVSEYQNNRTQDFSTYSQIVKI